MLKLKNYKFYLFRTFYSFRTECPISSVTCVKRFERCANAGLIKSSWRISFTIFSVMMVMAQHLACGSLMNRGKHSRDRFFWRFLGSLLKRHSSFLKTSVMKLAPRRVICTTIRFSHVKSWFQTQMIRVLDFLLK